MKLLRSISRSGWLQASLIALVVLSGAGLLAGFQNYSSLLDQVYDLKVFNSATFRSSNNNGTPITVTDPTGATTELTIDHAGNLSTTGTLAQSTAQTDGYQFFGPDVCQLTPATTAFSAGPALVEANANNLVLSGTTNTTAGTVRVTCNLPLASRTTATKGLTVTGVDLYYGVQTTALSSIAAATPATVAFPAAGGSAAGTVAAAGGTLTVTPGSLQVATTTAGQCYHENLAFGTALALNSAVKELSLDQVFTTAGTTATTLQVCGVGVEYNNNPL